MLESLFIKAAGFPASVFNFKICDIFKSTFIEEHLGTNASDVKTKLLITRRKSLIGFKTSRLL